jgi:cytidine deaminase
VSDRAVSAPLEGFTDPVARGLIEAAFEAISRRYIPDRHQIAAAVLDAEGGIHIGLHLDAMVGRAAVCAEAGALSAARLVTDAELVAVAAVRYPKPIEPPRARLVPPCGLCRELLLDHAPALRVAVHDGPETGLAPLAGLLPHKYVGTKWPAASITRT